MPKVSYEYHKAVALKSLKTGDIFEHGSNLFQLLNQGQGEATATRNLRASSLCSGRVNLFTPEHQVYLVKGPITLENN